MTSKEYYPSLKEILEALSSDCILVGSATKKDINSCKDIDFVINENGWKTLLSYDYYLAKEDSNWRIYIPYDHADKCVDFFYGICNIFDVKKHENRMTYQEAEKLVHKTTLVHGVEVLSI